MPDADIDRDARTEEPTARRIEEAREKGRVAKSHETVSVLVTLVAIVFIWIYMPMLYKGLADIFNWSVQSFSSGVPDGPASGAAVLACAGRRVLFACAPIAGVVFFMAVAANVVQFGFVFSGEPVKPDINRINPVQGLGRLFSVRTAEMLALAVAKMSLAAVTVYLFVHHRGPRLVALMDGTIQGGVVAVLMEILYLALAMVLLFLVVAVVDLVFQRHQYLVDLRMTREEVKEELRRMEGDPAVRARRRAVMKRLLFTRMFAEIPESDVVVVNPTEFAVALRYRQGGDAAPVVTAKGRKRVAQKIRDIAAENSVPVVERPFLARGLFHAVDVGSEIPQEFYQMVAEVLAYVYRIGRERKVVA
ncbi:MAG: EscU/YscU/HrcU family type III secretion system export apparatus switch protein [Planctomycetes bacterium]|nr:EscU/YscU/HrcU family type III secretion system export apparatus switch protein [Planctomycetota bacterium]